MGDPSPDDLGAILTVLRRRRRLTLAGLARRTGVSPATLAALEGGALGLTPELGNRLVHVLAGRDRGARAMALLCCWTFQAELAQHRAMHALLSLDAVGCA